MRTWGTDYIIEFTPPTTDEIRNARPLATILPLDALTHAMLIAVTPCARTEGDRAVSQGRRAIASEGFANGGLGLSDGQGTQKTLLTRTLVLGIGQVR
jgi:hypothetical protein